MDDSNVITFKQPELVVQNETEECPHEESALSIEEQLIKRIDMLSGEIRKDMSTVKRALTDNNEHIEQEFVEMRRRIERIEERNINQNQNLLEHTTPPLFRESRGLTDNITSTPEHQASRFQNRNSASPSQGQQNQSPDKLVKIKPQHYDGSDDWDEYLTQFNILAELNGWSYQYKSLYLASSLTGNARALLNELDDEKRRDFTSLVVALNNRFGSENKAEYFRSKLQIKVRSPNESLMELAQSVKKMTRKAYPKATSDVINILALDHFIDAIPDTDLRIRLREVGPKNINEAENVAVRLETLRLADKQRGKHVRTVESQPNKLENTVQALGETLKEMTKEIKELKKKVDSSPAGHPYKNQQNWRNGNSRPPVNGNNQFQRYNYSNNNQGNRNWNSQANYHPSNPQRSFNSSNNTQGNKAWPSSGAITRQGQNQGPRRN